MGKKYNKSSDFDSLISIGLMFQSVLIETDIIRTILTQYLDI